MQRIYKNFEIIQYDKTVANVNDILKFNADVYAVVLPLNLISELLNSTSSDVIQPVSGRVETGEKILNKVSSQLESEYVYKHVYWQKIIECKITTERL
ncbi:MAG: hypothetical protein K2J37_07555 [Ruminococcus sp.]|nr:hypothetical protein [Ruminococcus sp.]MDE6784698.1 hypothetical protein [Ruminococcus sp.]